RGAILETALDAIITLDCGGRVLEFNPAAGAMVARGRILGTIAFVGAESGHRYTADSLPLAEELARRAAIAVDNARLYAAAQKEIEERQRAEQALQESRDYYRTLTEAVPHLVWTTQPNGVPDYFNQRWLDYTGQNCRAGGTRRDVHQGGNLVSSGGERTDH